MVIRADGEWRSVWRSVEEQARETPPRAEYQALPPSSREFLSVGKTLYSNVLPSTRNNESLAFQ